MIPLLLARGALVEVPLAGFLAPANAIAQPTMVVTVTDAAEAEPWLTTELGEHTAIGVLRGQTAVPAPDSIARLALAQWARRWWPTSVRLAINPLPLDLLDLEGAVLAAELHEMLDDFEPTAAEWFDRIGDHVGDPTGSARAFSARLDRHFDALGDVDRAERARHLTVGLPVQRDFALAAGAATDREERDVVSAGFASVDWRDVPPGELDAADDTIGWRLAVEGDSVALDIEVAALPTSEHPFEAHIENARWQQRVPLMLSGASHAGSHTLSDDVAADLLRRPDMSIRIMPKGMPQATVPTDGTEATAMRASVIDWVNRRANAQGDDLLLAERSARW